MPNIDAPNGFTPVRHMKGGVVRYDGGYTIASGLAANIFSGDAVAYTGTSKNITVAAPATGRILGIFAGCHYQAENGDVIWTNRWVTGTVTKGAAPAEAFVYTDPGIVYSAQCDDDALEVTEIGGFADFIATHTGNTATGISQQEIDATSAAATILQFKILGLAPQIDGITPSDISSSWPRVEVIVAEGEFNGILA